MATSQSSTASFSSAGNAADPLVSAAMPAVTGLSKGMAKAKMAGASIAADPVIDSSDISLGILRYIVASTDLFGCETIDTITVQATALENWVSITGSKTCANRSEYYSVTDADGNGIVAGPAEVNPKAHLLYSVIYTANDLLGHKSGMAETMLLTASAGPDNDFDTDSDNVIFEAVWNRTLNGDTLAYAEYSDADGDGIIIDNGSASASVVDVAYFEKDPAFNPFVDKSSLNMRLITDGNSENDQVIRINGEETLISGRVNSIIVLDTTGDSTISDNEIAEAIFSTVVSPATDSIISWRLSTVFDPVDGLANDKDNLYYELHSNWQKRFGYVRSMTYDFTTTEPVAQGADPTSGHIEMSVEYSDGRTASIVADFSQGYFTGVYTAPDGSTTTVTWDENGKVVTNG
jgi:hypothetical protein